MPSLPDTVGAQAWKTFLTSRFASPSTTKTPRLTKTERIAELDHELEILQHSDFITFAKRQRNANLPSCSLPPEVLSRVFWYAQEGWKPRRSIDNDVITLGWIILTHVCNKWREVALSSSPLWCDVSCYALPIGAVPALIERSRRSPLDLAFEGIFRGDDKKSPYTIALRKIWLSRSVSSRVRSLTIEEMATSRWHSRQWSSLIGNPMPALEELRIHISLRESDEASVLPDTIFTSTSPLGLRSISLFNCFLPWSSPLFTSNITHLDLGEQESTPTLLPSPALFHQVLSRLQRLESLSLMNIFPLPDPNDLFTTELSDTLKDVTMSATVISMIEPCLKAFLSITTTRPARYSIDIFTATEHALMSEALAHLFQPAPDPYKELCIASNAFSTLSPPEWTAGDPETGLEWLGGGAYTFELERRFTLSDVENSTLSIFYYPYLSFVRMDRIERLSIASGAVCAFRDDDAWKTTFRRATQISSLALPYAPALCHLFGALEETAAPSPGATEAKEMTLFPALKVVALYLYEDANADAIDIDDIASAQLRIELLNLMHVRKDAGCPIEQLRVAKGVLGDADIRGLAEIVTVEQF
ncbi:unnamed protein product [Peniophora sp. CBMAI 1063]|nr:unnamed protein product [Peniophora sp. CBMAI 1063]